MKIRLKGNTWDGRSPTRTRPTTQLAKWMSQLELINPNQESQLLGSAEDTRELQRRNQLSQPHAAIANQTPELRTLEKNTELLTWRPRWKAYMRSRHNWMSKAYYGRTCKPSVCKSSPQYTRARVSPSGIRSSASFTFIKVYCAKLWQELNNQISLRKWIGGNERKSLRDIYLLWTPSLEIMSFLWRKSNSSDKLT